jgi:uncharacterized protein with PIN domain
MSSDCCPIFRIGLAAVTPEQIEITTEGFRRFGRGRYRAGYDLRGAPYFLKGEA